MARGRWHGGRSPTVRQLPPMSESAHVRDTIRLHVADSVAPTSAACHICSAAADTRTSSNGECGCGLPRSNCSVEWHSNWASHTGTCRSLKHSCTLRRRCYIASERTALQQPSMRHRRTARTSFIVSCAARHSAGETCGNASRLSSPAKRLWQRRTQQCRSRWQSAACLTL